MAARIAPLTPDRDRAYIRLLKKQSILPEADHGAWTREQLKPYIAHVIDCFGTGRVMYGGDWPVSVLAGTYTGWVEVLDWVTEGCSSAEKHEIFHDNAISAYRL